MIVFQKKLQAAARAPFAPGSLLSDQGDTTGLEAF
jgi:hypothetical protein